MLRNNKLEIFENFVIDRSLPKFTTGENITLGGTLTSPTQNGTIVIRTGSSTAFAGTTNSVVDNGWVVQVPQGIGSVEFDSDAKANGVPEKKPGFWVNLLSGKSKAEKKKIKEDQIKTLNIVQFFSSLGNNLQSLPELVDIAVHYETMISNAKAAGQTALVETLKSRLEAARTESALVAADLKQYLTEQQIIDFYNQTSKDRALKLTWIKNFIKPIPTKILEVKKALDEKFAFDNYVVLHYDPNNDATNLTKEEKEEVERRKKDPILFGVIQSSRRLYYIGDWIDEYCNLTLDVVIEKLGDNVGTINNESVKTYIDRGFLPEARFPKEAPATQKDKSLLSEYKENAKEAIKAIDKVIRPRKTAKATSKKKK